MTPSNDSVPTSPTVRTTIEPGLGRVAFDRRELWQHRELLYFFVWRDLKVRYKQTAFGFLWALIQPLAFMLVFALVLGRVQGIAPPDVPYALFTLTALVPWTLFSQGLVGGSESVVQAAGVIQKVYFPRVLLPIAGVGSYLVDYAIGMALLGLIVVLGIGLSATAVWVAPLTVIIALVAVAFGTWFAAINVRYRDVRHAVPFLVQLWLFASPVAYSSDVIPDELWLVYHLNPMAGSIEAFRWALLDPSADPPLGALALAIAVTAIVLVTGLLYFRKAERTFADVV